MTNRYSRIFLLSHMRAFTSLAGHILGSNQAINGYFEMHLSYADSAALERQFTEYLNYETIKDNSRYLFDKLLHNQYQLQPELLEPAIIKILVALREPESTIKSIVNLFAQRQEKASYAIPDEATRYYIERLAWLAEFCRTRRQTYYYFDADLFKTAPEMLLATLSEWLELVTPLSAHYQLFSQTGKARKGDSSIFIHNGKIDLTRSDHSDIHIPQQLITEAQVAYRNCRQTMIEHAAGSVTS